MHVIKCTDATLTMKYMFIIETTYNLARNWHNYAKLQATVRDHSVAARHLAVLIAESNEQCIVFDTQLRPVGLNS